MIIPRILINVKYKNLFFSYEHVAKDEKVVHKISLHAHGKKALQKLGDM